VAVTLASEILLTTVCGSIAGVVVTTVVLDIGIQGWGTAMQTITQSLTNEARSRVTAIFIFMLFMGGSAAGSSLYQHFGWTADRFFGIGLILVAGWRETKHGLLARGPGRP
jgi:Ca2+/Na+ antiporter